MKTRSPRLVPSFAKRQKILYLVTQGILGGPRTHLNHLIAHIYQDYEIRVAVGMENCMSDYLEMGELPFERVKSLVRPISLLKDTYAVKELIKLITDFKPDLISTHSSKAGVLGRIAAHYCKTPAIFTAHGWSFTEGIPGRQRLPYLWVERLMAPLAERIICVSEFDRQLAIKHRVARPDQLVTVTNAMPNEARAIKACPAREDPVRLIMVARFCEQKDHELLFQAMANLKIDSVYNLDLVGDGPLLKPAQELAQRLGIMNKVTFWGASKKVPELLSTAQVFLLISKWEGFPRSILEAMRAGLPVIASAVGGVTEAVINGETGLTVPSGDINSLMQALKSLISDRELRVKLGDKGFQRFREHFTFDKLLSKTVAVYEEVLTKSRRAKLAASGNNPYNQVYGDNW